MLEDLAEQAATGRANEAARPRASGEAPDRNVGSDFIPGQSRAACRVVAAREAGVRGSGYRSLLAGRCRQTDGVGNRRRTDSQGAGILSGAVKETLSEPASLVAKKLAEIVAHRSRRSCEGKADCPGIGWHSFRVRSRLSSKTNREESGLSRLQDTVASGESWRCSSRNVPLGARRPWRDDGRGRRARNRETDSFSVRWRRRSDSPAKRCGNRCTTSF